VPTPGAAWSGHLFPGLNVVLSAWCLYVGLLSACLVVDCFVVGCVLFRYA
jgi:hypothetical protein